MQHLGFRYTSLLAVVMTLFVTFVACGSQLYQVSLHGDSGPRPSATQSTAPAAGGALMASGPDGNADPKSPNFGLHAPGGWDSLPIHYRVDSTMPAAQVTQIQAAMHTWEVATGKVLFAYDGVHQGITGDSFKDLYSSLDDSKNGLYIDNDWLKTGKPTVVLATTIWDNDPSDVSKILTADIRYNDQYYIFGDALVIKPQGTREVVDLQTVATHELGHFLGLIHVDPSIDAHSIMVASLYIGQGLTTRALSSGDIKRIQRIYGCGGSACNVVATQALIEKMVHEAPSSPPTASLESPNKSTVAK
ncbi:MAG: matrixin family metalloprotease [Proteobacteria bacterium]|nr:matrixin family metalloprotease [Pseudomonadota bacterium]